MAWIHRGGRILERADYTFYQKMTMWCQSPKLAKKQSSLLIALDFVNKIK